MRPVRRRQALAALALLGVTAGLAVVALHDAPAPPPAVRARDGVVIRGFHTRRLVAGRQTADVAADELLFEGTRVGPFRLGFGRRLTVRNARIEVRTIVGGPAGDLEPRIPPGPGRAAATPAVSSLHFDRVRLLVTGHGGATELAIRAAECDADVWTHGMLVCRRLRVQADGVDQRFDRLTYDPTSARFTTPAGAVRSLEPVTRRLARFPARELRAVFEGLPL